jgi:hypothetical protein
MSAAELLHRVRQKASARIERLGIGTVGSVPPPDLSQQGCGVLAVEDNVPSGAYVLAASEILAGRLQVFGLVLDSGTAPNWNRDPKTGAVAPLDFGKTLNYRDESLVGDIKYLWEPNRHLHLVTLAQAYRLTGEPGYLGGLRRQLDSWLDQCPYLRGPNWTSSLELAIRLINWSIAWELIGGSRSPLFEGETGARFRDRWLRSIYKHMHFIRGHFSRYSSANNHLIGELAGLYVASVAWPFWPVTTKWRRAAKDGLEREVLLQTGADGVNREQAISYQQFVLDFLLLAGVAARGVGDGFSNAYWQRVEAMLEFVASLMDVGGNVPMIGDADDGYVVRLSQEPAFCPYRSLLATGAVLFERGDFRAKAGALDDKTRWLLGSEVKAKWNRISPRTADLPVRRAFPEGGYCVLGSDFETDREIRLIVDAGPLGYQSIAAHGHADALAFTLSVGGYEFLADPGTYAYHTQRAWRDYFRGTAAHNTVVVDGQDQSVSGGNFMWIRHARAACEAWESSESEDRFIGSHDGYMRLPDPVLHRRTVTFEKATRTIRVVDTLQCRKSHVVEHNWHFAEYCRVLVADDGAIVADNGRFRIRLSPGAKPAEIAVRRGQSNPIGGWISRRLDVKTATTTVVWKTRIDGTCDIVTTIEVAKL